MYKLEKIKSYESLKFWRKKGKCVFFYLCNKEGEIETLKRETEMESFLRKKEMSSRIVLLACGSFNPPHYLHARIFEVARNYMSKRNRHTVVHGWISPVSDGYGKPGLGGYVF